MLSFLSKAPLALLDEHSIYREIITSLNSKIDTTRALPFSFKSTKQTYDEATRKIVPLGRIIKEDRDIHSLFSSWIEKRLPYYLKYLSNEVRTKDYSFKDPDSFRIVLRLRILEDQKGYSLAPHRDSEDTLFAFLLQLDPENPTTSAFLKDKQVFKVRGTHPDISDNSGAVSFYRNFFHSIDKTPNFQLDENAFGYSKFIAWHEDGSAWAAQASNDLLFVTRYDGFRLDVPFGCLLGLHNPLRDYAFSSAYTEYLQQNCAHGFFPSSFEKRPVLLMDLLCGYTSEDTLFSRYGNCTDEEFYFFFRRSTSEKVLKTAGFF
jgi:hypothetical protein